MAFRGKQLSLCRSFDVVSNYLELVWVPSDSIACGHVLLKIGILNNGVSEDYYFHVPGFDGTNINSHFGLFEEPYFFKSSEFNTYLVSNNKEKKRVVRRKYSLNATDKLRVSAKLSQLLEKKWKYYLVVNNCQSFVEEIINSSSHKIEDNTIMDCPGKDFNIQDFRHNVQRSFQFKLINFLMSR